MMEYGEKVTADPSTFDDPQYMFLRERLKALRDGWEEVHQMWENRQQLLSQSLNLQMFNRDAKQAEVLLSQQEHLLSKDETPSNLEQAESLIKKHEALLTTMEANDDKVNGVLQFAQRLCSEQHFASDKISRKADDISERRNVNHELALAQLEKLKDQLLLHQFLQDCEELNDWIQEKNVLVQEDTYRSAKTIHSKWTRHQAFESEIESNKERLDRVKESGEELLKNKPEMSELIRPKIQELEEGFDALQRNTKEKGERIFDAKRADLYEQSCDDIDSFVMDLERQIETEPVEGLDNLTSVTILMQKQQMIETQMQVKSQQVSELDDQAEKLVKMEPEKKEEIEAKKVEVSKKFERVMAPLEARKKELVQKKQIFQFMRDVEDENIWVEEKMNLVTSEDYGDSLQAVNMLIKKNQTLKGEIDNHGPIIERVCEDGKILIESGHPDSEQFQRDIDDLKEKLQHLKVRDWRKRFIVMDLFYCFTINFCRKCWKSGGRSCWCRRRPSSSSSMPTKPRSGCPSKSCT